MTVELLLAIIKEKKDHWGDHGISLEERKVLDEILKEYEKRKNQCKCTEFDGAFNKPYYECICGHHWKRHIEGPTWCEGAKPADVDHKIIRRAERLKDI